MNKPKIVAAFRLTLKTDAIRAITAAPKKPFKFIPFRRRPEINGADVLISTNTADQLMTFAKAGENLSDTVLRLMALQKT